MIRTVLCCAAMLGVWPSAAAAATTSDADLRAEHLRSWRLDRQELERRSIRYPLWVSRPDGSWRATLKSFAVNAQIDEDLFTPALAADQ